MKLTEIVDDEPLVLQLMRQQIKKGDTIYLDDSQITMGEEWLKKFWRASPDAFAFRVVDSNGRTTELMYTPHDVEQAELSRRDATSWTLEISNEAENEAE